MNFEHPAPAIAAVIDGLGACPWKWCKSRDCGIAMEPLLRGVS